MSRDDERYTVAVAAALRRPLLAHHRRLTTVCNAPHADDERRYAHPVVVVLMPRQTGKTSTILALALGRGRARRDYRAAYTAQRGTVVTERFTGDGDGWITTVQRSPLASFYRYSRRAGVERITRHDTGSFLRGFPPVDGALRSLALDAVIVDEAQEHSDDLGAALDATITPVFTTRPRRQLIVAGTAGARPDSWWHRYVERARAGVHGLVELGTWPDDADPDDERVWAEHHPGVLAGMTTVDELRAARDVLGPDAFAREYGNRWASAARPVSAIADALWLPARTDTTPTRPAAVGFDVAPGNTAGTVVAVGADAGGRLVAGIVEHRPGGTAWLAPLVARLRRQYRIPVGTDPGGPAGPVADELRIRHGVDVEPITAAEYVTACGALLAGLDARTHAYRPAPELDAARAAVVLRVTDRGGSYISRGHSAGDVSPLTAWAIAAWLARRPAAAPRIVTAAATRRDP